MRWTALTILTAYGSALLVWGLVNWIDGDKRGKFLAIRGAAAVILGIILERMG